MIVTDLRTYRSAIEQGQRIGVSQKQAVHAVALERRRGESGRGTVQLFQRAAMRGGNEPSPPAAA